MIEASVPTDVQTLERLMAQYGDNLLRMCWMLLQDRELARDAAQESFLKAYRALGSLRNGETEKAWLMRIAINTCRDMRRSRWWRMVDRRVTPDDLPEAGREDALPDSMPLIEVLNLPEKYRQVVLLHYYQGLTLEEIARTLDASASTIRTRLSRAKAKLRQKLERWYYDE
ncbi:MAG TPA: sigma-70 family RNA polymerase sigma factor [Clostridia bacterium]|nr:sigma-70 family RNA polymerase sigma factor [Clostridia bacterium]